MKKTVSNIVSSSSERIRQKLDVMISNGDWTQPPESLENILIKKRRGNHEITLQNILIFSLSLLIT